MSGRSASGRCGGAIRDGGCEPWPGSRSGSARQIDALAGCRAGTVRCSSAVHFTDGAYDLGFDIEVRPRNCRPDACHLPLDGWRGSTLLAVPRLVAVLLRFEHPMADEGDTLGLHGG